MAREAPRIDFKINTSRFKNPYNKTKPLNAVNKTIKKPAKSVGGVYLADGTEYKGKNGKPSGTGTVAPRLLGVDMVAPRRPGKSVAKPTSASISAARSAAAKSVSRGAYALNKPITKAAKSAAKPAFALNKTIKKPAKSASRGAYALNKPIKKSR